MKKLNFNFQILNLDGEELTKANKLFAQALMSEKAGDPVKYFDWAMSLNKEGEIEVDNADFDKIKEIAKNSETLTILSKAQFLKFLDKVK